MSLETSVAANNERAGRESLAQVDEPSRRWSAGERAVWALGAVFQLLVVGYFAANFDRAIPRLVADDAFYYLKIADNVAHGLGSVFSPGEPTNGYHPLWMLMLAGIGLFRPDPSTYVVAMLLMAVACNLLGATQLRTLLQEIGCSPAQRTAGLALWLLSPPMVNLTLSGLETPILLATLMAMFVWARRVFAAEPPAWRQAVGLGIASGLLMLARTDTIFFTSITFLYLLWRRGRRLLGPLTLAGGLASLVILPWLAWSYWRFGTIMQSSAGSMPALWRWLADQEGRSWLDWTRYYVMQIFAPLYHLFVGVLFPWVMDNRLKAPLVLVGCGGLWLYFKLGSKRLLANFPWMIWAAPAVLILLFCAWGRMFMQIWHLAPMLATAILAATLLARDEWLRGARLPGAIALLLLATTLSLQNCFFHFFQVDNVRCAREYLRDSPRQLRIGTTDAGYLGFFNRHEIVNLDGVVNNRAEAAIKAGRLSDYVESEHFDRVLIDRRRLPFYDRNRSASAAILLAPSPDSPSPVEPPPKR